MCRRFSRKMRLGHVLLLVGCLASVPARAEPYPLEMLKAVFLYNFVRYIEWPKKAIAKNEPLTLCLAEGGKVISPLRQLVEGRRVRGHPLRVFGFRTSLEPICHLIFLEGESPPPDFLSEVSLLVGEADDFFSRGGAIRLLVKNRHLAFEVNLGWARSHGFRIRADLLRLAQRVHNLEDQEPEKKKNSFPE